jgi:hypothetical protein
VNLVGRHLSPGRYKLAAFNPPHKSLPRNSKLGNPLNEVLV